MWSKFIFLVKWTNAGKNGWMSHAEIDWLCNFSDLNITNTTNEWTSNGETLGFENMWMSAQEQRSCSIRREELCRSNCWIRIDRINYQCDDILWFDCSHCMPLAIAEVLTILRMENGREWTITIVDGQTDGTINQLDCEHCALSIHR